MMSCPVCVWLCPDPKLARHSSLAVYVPVCPCVRLCPFPIHTVLILASDLRIREVGPTCINVQVRSYVRDTSHHNANRVFRFYYVIHPSLQPFCFCLGQHGSNTSGDSYVRGVSPTARLSWARGPADFERKQRGNWSSHATTRRHNTVLRAGTGCCWMCSKNEGDQHTSGPLRSHQNKQQQQQQQRQQQRRHKNRDTERVLAVAVVVVVCLFVRQGGQQGTFCADVGTVELLIDKERRTKGKHSQRFAQATKHRQSSSTPYLCKLGTTGNSGIVYTRGSKKRVLHSSTPSPLIVTTGCLCSVAYLSARRCSPFPPWRATNLTERQCSSSSRNMKEKGRVSERLDSRVVQPSFRMINGIGSNELRMSHQPMLLRNDNN